MPKTYFHNHKIIYENKDKKKLLQSPNIDTKHIVNINILLNRLKIDQQNEKKRQIIFYSFSIFGISLLGMLISIFK